ncbi:MAG: nickel pincer cofactor biosynthesis protein LarB [Candidatus Rifleibacteriota bacterium]
MEPVNLRIRKILENFRHGNISTADAETALAKEFSHGVETESAVIDTTREYRTGFPEAIYAAGKTPQQVVEIFAKMLETNGKALATRCTDATLDAIEQNFATANIDRSSRLAWFRPDIEILARSKVAVLAAGTSDWPVSEEAAITLEFAGCLVERVYDVGVAGIHRLLGRTETFADADAAIVVAGMEGALPSVVGGLVTCPVIAVPTSVGYGASFGGIAALLGMLNSCSAGVTVVNIDNGFGAAVAAIRIVKGKKK